MNAHRLKSLRLAENMTLRDLAQESGIAHSTIWRLENNLSVNPSEATLVALAQTLEVPIDTLVTPDAPAPRKRW